MSSLYIFIDEAGDFDFSQKGSKYLILTSVTTDNIMPLARELYELKHDLISNTGLEVEYFHARDDRRQVRDRVYSVIERNSNIRVDAIIAEKAKTHPSLTAPCKFYPRMMGILLKWIYQFLPPQNYSGVFVFMDYLQLPGQREAFMKGAKEAAPLPATGATLWRHVASLYVASLFASSRLLWLGYTKEVGATGRYTMESHQGTA